MKKQVILCTAARLFAERGFSNTPTVLLAQEAGVAEGTIFRHFKTKDDIFFVLIDNVKEQMIADIQKYLDVHHSKNGLDEVLNIMRAFCVFVRKNRMEFGLVFRDASSRYGDESDHAFQVIKAMHMEIADLILQAISRGQGDGSIGKAIHAQDTAAQIVCLLVGFTRGLHFNLIAVPEDQSMLVPHLLHNMAMLLSPEASAACPCLGATP